MEMGMNGNDSRWVIRPEDMLYAHWGRSVQAEFMGRARLSGASDSRQLRAAPCRRLRDPTVPTTAAALRVHVAEF